MSRLKLKKPKTDTLRAARICAAGCELFWAGNLRDAEKLFRASVKMSADLYEGWQNLGSSLIEQGRIEEGMQYQIRAIEINPGRPSAYYGLAVGNYLLRNVGTAAAYARMALQTDCSYHDAHMILGHALILSGDYAPGWEEHEKSREHRYNRDFPLWNGERLRGKKILLLCEQGFGDDLHFIRYARLVKDRGAHVVVGCKPPLSRLFKTVPGVDRVVPFNSPPPDFDYYAPLMRLPYIFKTTLATIPAEIPYLVANPKHEIRNQNLQVGICWAGGAREHDPKANRVDKRRSISLGAFDPILDSPGIDFYSLQKGDGAVQTDSRLIDRTAEFNDFLDTASFVQTLDLVITVDTAIAHLAGGLGKPVWMLSRYDGCWRWGLSGDTTPWYPTMRIFRQEKPGDWSGTLQNVADTLQRRAGIPARRKEGSESC